MVFDKEVTIRSSKDKQDKQDKYGCYLANIVLKYGFEVKQWLVDNGHAKPYFP